MKHNPLFRKSVSYIIIINLLFISIIPFNYNAKNFIHGFIFSHYLVLIIHNIFLGISNHILCQYIDIENLLIPRTNYYRYLWLIVIITFFQIFIYFSLLLVYGTLIFGIKSTFSYPSLFLLCLYFTIMLLSHFLLFIQIFKEKNNIYIVLAIAFNLFIHYFFIIPNF